MNELVNAIIESLYTEIVDSARVIVIYPGRFQPPGPHHFSAYGWLVDKFGKENVYIASSNDTSGDKNPLSFQDKKSIWKMMGVSDKNIVQVKNPYKADEILSTLNPNDAVVYAYGEKDSGRLLVGKKKDGSPSYLQNYTNNKQALEPFSKHGYVIILPHKSIKIDGRELSGTEIRNLISSNPSKETFKKIFGWFDERIFNILVSKFKKEELTEGGNIFDETSMVRKENVDTVIKQVLKDNGLEGLVYSKIGNLDKPLAGDIDIAIDTNDLIKFLGLPKEASKDDLFSSIEKKIPNSKTAKGLNQFHLLGKVDQPFIEKDGTEDENREALVQVDVMLGNRKWREKFMSGAPGSEYKAMFRNLFLGEVFSKVIENESVEGLKRKHMISPAEGFYLMRFVTDNKGKRKEISRELLSDDADFVARFLFGDDKSFADISTFEKLYALFKSKEFKFPQYREEIKNGFKHMIKTFGDKDASLKLPTVNEDKISIQRFSGPNEMSDVEFLTLLRKLQPLAEKGKIDLSVPDRASVTEKLDASPCTWGLNASKQFYMESANSGEVTISNVDKFNNPFTSHFYEALKFLNSYKPFQQRLGKVFDAFGPFRVTSEMFPMLTHKGNELGDVVFCSTRYSKEKFGEKGAFVCFSAETTKLGDKASDSVLQGIQNTDDPQWKVYNINVHGNLSTAGLAFDISGVAKFVSDDKKLADAITILKSRTKSPEKDALSDLVKKTKVQLQGVLNQYAQEINSFLGSTNDRKYPVEGVVMKVKVPDGDIFVKGTSEIFHKIAEKTWGTRKKAGEIEKVLDGNFLKNALGLKSSQAALLNKTIAASKEKFAGNDEETKNKIALDVYNQLKSDNVDMSDGAIKHRALAEINVAVKEMESLVSDWEKISSSGEVDPDTVGKTDSQLEYISNRLKKIKNAFNTSYTGDALIVYLLRLFIDKRIG